MMGRHTGLLLVMLGTLAGWWFWSAPETMMALRGYRMVRLPSVSGPAMASRVAETSPTAWSRFSEGGSHRLAILLTDPQSNWLGLTHGLKAKGIPFVVTDRPDQALRHRVVLVYPTLSGKVLSRDALQQLATHPREGGTLIACGGVGGGLEEVFGISAMQESRTPTALRFHGDPWSLREEGSTQGWTVPLHHPNGVEPPIGVTLYRSVTASVLASYDDGSAAVVQRAVGLGWAVAVGIDVGYVLWRGQALRAEGFAGSFNNRFVPGTDAVLLFLEAVYRRGDSFPVTLDPIPEGRDLAVLLTHDVDAQSSMHNALEFARVERARGVRGTFFIQTKYIRDLNDEVFLTDRWIEEMRQLATMGMEVGSHTVAHSKVFDQFPLGSGTERYPDYRPIVTGRLSARGGTVLGELRVSKFILETLVPGLVVQSFRAGELAYPLTLPQALEATGYRYDSTATANTALTHLPYRLTKDRLPHTEVEVYEFPVSIEDEELPPLGDRFPDAVKLADQLGRYGGVMTVLIHPNMLGHKLAFEARLIEALAARAWIGAVEDFGRWWEARDHVEVDVLESPGGIRLAVTAPKPIDGLVLALPPGCAVNGEGATVWRRPWPAASVKVSLERGAKTEILLRGCSST